MRILTDVCYNLDVLCALNTMTADEYYVQRHQALFERFYPFISDTTKQRLHAFTKAQGYTMLSPTLTLFVSSLPRFQERNLADMLASHAEIEACMNASPYRFTREEFDMYFYHIDQAILPLLDELAREGLHDYWRTHVLPQIEAKQQHLATVLAPHDIENLLGRYHAVDATNFTVFLCAFVKPHGIKLCGNNLISDCSYSDDDILSNVTHEAFHPAFDFDAVRPSLDKLAALPFVRDAFAKQNPNSGYHDMDGFIEEHIVETLGIHTLLQLGVGWDSYDYFRRHDEGSHVLSPLFYRYLLETEKDPAEPFEAYFTRFADSICQ